MPREQCTDTVRNNEKTQVVGHDREGSVWDCEEAVILTARRVRIVRYCRARRTTLPSVRFTPVSSDGADKKQIVTMRGPK